MKRTAIFVLGAMLLGSCSDMGDSVKDFVTEETVYPGKFDFARAKIGYERVEIDLLQAGRIPASEIHLGKAKKTVVEYADERVVIDSVCSWVEITGLTQQMTYEFSVYTMDEHGNKSLPEEVLQTPFTAATKALLVIPAPVIERVGTDATVEWKQDISSISLTYLSKLTCSYTDKDDTPRKVTLDDTPAQPSFTVTNIPTTGVTLSMEYYVKPKVSNVEIIDAIWIERPLVIPAL